MIEQARIVFTDLPVFPVHLIISSSLQMTSLFTHSREWQFACKFIKENSIFKLFLPTVVIVETTKKSVLVCMNQFPRLEPIKLYEANENFTD